MIPPDFKVSAEVAAALSARHPVVALETAVLTHGLPAPDNILAVERMEAAVRAAGAVPAVVGIVDGRVRIGLQGSDLRLLGAGGARKCSMRDLAVIVADGASGGTTVAATCWAASACGIRTVATGGIGGVHRASRFDVSADLQVLGNTPVMVVCSGAKSLLDLPATLEVLERLGVAVIGYRTDELPAFVANDSGIRLCHRVDEPRQAAAIADARDRLGLDAGIVLAVPCPANVALAFAEAEVAAAEADRAAVAEGHAGAERTPAALRRLDALTNGRSRTANLALLENNARVAGAIAAALGPVDRAALRS